MNRVSTTKKVIGIILLIITLAAMLLPILKIIPTSIGILVILLVRFIAAFT